MEKGRKGPARVRPRSKGVFCLESVDWWGKLHRSSSVEPILELLSHWDPFYVPFVHRDVDTCAEFDHYLRKWAGRSLSRYPILYLALHGEAGELFFGDLRRTENAVTLDDLGLVLEGQCHGRMIHLGACESLDLHGKTIRRFLRQSGALAVCGYRNYIDWMESCAFDLIVLSCMQMQAFTTAGARAMRRRIAERASALSKRLGFRMVVRA